jgi:hypothetical protein
MNCEVINSCTPGSAQRKPVSLAAVLLTTPYLNWRWRVRAIRCNLYRASRKPLLGNVCRTQQGRVVHDERREVDRM